MDFLELLGIKITKQEPGFVEASMEVKQHHLQAFGFLHGGVTLALLETVGSYAGAAYANLEKERPFGVSINAHHVKLAALGEVITGTATFTGSEKNLYHFDVEARDSKGDTISHGTFDVKIVTLERLAQLEKLEAERSFTKEDR